MMTIFYLSVIPIKTNCTLYTLYFLNKKRVKVYQGLGFLIFSKENRGNAKEKQKRLQENIKNSDNQRKTLETH